MDEKQYAVLLTETQDVKVIACNPDKDIFDTIFLLKTR